MAPIVGVGVRTAWQGGGRTSRGEKDGQGDLGQESGRDKGGRQMRARREDGEGALEGLEEGSGNGWAREPLHTAEIGNREQQVEGWEQGIRSWRLTLGE